MSARPTHLGLAAALLCLTAACGGSGTVAEQATTVALVDPPAGPYLGQTPPGLEPRVFAPGFISTGMAERDLAMTPDLAEIYFTTLLGSGSDYSAILLTREIDGRWTAPEVAPFSGRYKDLEPAIAPDGRTLMFVSTRPLLGSSEPRADEDIWMVQRQADLWGPPQPVGPPINTPAAEFFPSLTRGGTLYFTRRADDRTESIYRARRADSGFQEPEKLPPQVNGAPTQFNAFIDPDERFIIVCAWGREDSLGGVDYYVSFRSPSDVWSGPINLGPLVNSATGQEWSPYVSPDGKYLFFMSSRSPLAAGPPESPLEATEIRRRHTQHGNGNSDIWWIDAALIESLRPPDLE